jgi:hypothetical protein
MECRARDNVPETSTLKPLSGAPTPPQIRSAAARLPLRAASSSFAGNGAVEQNVLGVHGHRLRRPGLGEYHRNLFLIFVSHPRGAPHLLGTMKFPAGVKKFPAPVNNFPALAA